MSDLGLTSELEAKTKPVGRFRWYVVGLLLIGAIVNYFDRSNLSIANPIISKEFHIGPAQMGVLLSAFLWPYAIMNLPSGWLIDRVGPKRMFGWASALWSLVTVVSGFAHSFSFLYFMRTLLGVTESPLFAAGTKVCDRWFKKHERGLAISIFLAGPQVASAIAPPLLTALMLAFTWHNMFIIIGLSGLIVTILWVITYKDPKLTSQRTGVYKQHPVVKTDKTAWLSLFRYRPTWAMIVGNFGIQFTIYVFMTWLPGYLVMSRHLSILKTGWVASIPFMAGIISVPLGGAISDFLIRKGHRAITSRKVAIVAPCILSAIFVAPVAYVSSVTFSVVLIAIGFFAAAMPNGVLWTLATDVAPPDAVASLGAIQNFGGYIGASLAPITTGVILQLTGTFNLVFVVGAVFCVISAISYGFFLKKPIKEAHTSGM